MYIDESAKEVLGRADINSTICRDFAEFYGDYGFVSQWADISEVGTTELPTAGREKPNLAAVLLKGVVMNGRPHEFQYTLHRYNHGPFSAEELEVIANVAGVSRDVVIIESHEEASDRPFTHTPYGARIYYDPPPQPAAA